MICTIFDYETLDKYAPKAAVVAMSALNFCLEECRANFYTYESLMDDCDVYLFDVEEQKNDLGKTVSQDTVTWWMNDVDQSVVKELFSPHNRISIRELVPLLKEITRESDIVFSRGNTFDPVITQCTAHDLGKNPPYPFWKDRDTRSFLDAYLWDTPLENSFMPKGVPENVNKHDPRVDIVLDILRIQTVLSNVC